MVRHWGLFALCAGFAILGAGCSSSTPETTVKKDDVPPGEHAHQSAEHGGIIVSIGRDNYHAEAVFEKDGILQLYMLGTDGAKSIDIENQTIKAFARTEERKDSTAFELKPVMQSGEAPGKASQFSGQLPRDLWGKKVEVTIPALLIGRLPFHINFTNVNAVHGEESMASAVSDEEESKLYLTAQGKYTDADIKANGSMTAARKFKGVMPSHDLKPKVGDKICPITLTKANPKFTWVVGGKVYEFCCPPCVDEFVQTAKTSPDEIKEPGEYVKKK